MSRGLCKSCYSAWRADVLHDKEAARAVLLHAEAVRSHWTGIAVRADPGSLEERQGVDLAAEWSQLADQRRRELDALERQTTA